MRKVRETILQETIDTKTETTQFYTDVVDLLLGKRLPFLVGGAFALKEYTDIHRDTKDLDLFCKPAQHQAILHAVAEAGYITEIVDPEWLAKIRRRDAFIDIIFSSRNRICIVDDRWFTFAHPAKLWDMDILLVPPEEMIWSKVYVQERDRFDGADINHLIRRYGTSLDWKRLMSNMDPHWELFYAMILQFFFVYPGERHAIPEWVVRECMNRMEQQLRMPPIQKKICRGLTLAYSQYQVDFTQWGYET